MLRAVSLITSLLLSFHSFVESGNTLSMDVGGDFDMIAGEDIIIESSAGISFQANVNDVTEVQQFG